MAKRLPRGPCGAILNLSKTSVYQVQLSYDQISHPQREQGGSYSIILLAATMPKLDKFTLDKIPPETLGRIL